MWSFIFSAASWVLGLLGFGKKDSNTAERQSGEDLGIQKTENANATAGLNEVQTAVAARDENHAAIAADPSRLLDGTDPAAASYKPGPD